MINYNRNKIDFIYFDVGGVALLDYSKTNKWEEMISDLKIPESLVGEFDNLFSEYSAKICLGTNVSEFANKFAELFNFEFPSDYAMLEDFVNRFEINAAITSLVLELSKKYRLGLLTNMYPDMLSLIKKRKLLPPVEWEIEIDSSIEKMRKPNENIYILAEDRAGVKGENILYIENQAKHLAIPKQRGWHTFLYDPANLENSTYKLKEYIHSN